MNVGLSSGSTGPEVARLHRVLEAAGMVIDEGERERQGFGPATVEVLLAFQRERALRPVGQIDVPTYAALLVVEETFTGPSQDRPEDRGTVQLTLLD